MSERQTMMMCTQCYGMGTIVEEKMAVINGRAGSRGVERQCPTCKGAEWIPFAAPVATPDMRDRDV